MAVACLGADVPRDVLAVLRRRTGGVPLLVEELLTAGADPAAVVPATVAELVAGRVNALHPAHRRCVEAAAVLGAHFDWRLLPSMVETTDADVHAALRAAIRAGLVQAQQGDRFTFHHALGRDAVLGALLPPERVEWARRGFVAVTAAHPELDSEWGDLAADLALRAGDAERAAVILVEAGRRNLAQGALASAETVLCRAADLVAKDSPLAADADEVLSEVLVQAGKTDDAVTVTTRTVQRLRRTAGTHRARAEAHLRLARVHATTGEWTAAAAQIDSVDPHSVDEDLRLQITLAAAQVALGGARFADAHQLATKALTASEHAGAWEVMCQALLVLGRIARRGDLAWSEKLFERAQTVAESAGLPVVAARALYEIAISDAQESLRLDRLDAARERARSLGDVAAVAVLDLQRAATFATRWEPEPMMEAVQLCVSASRRFRLATLPKALVFAAVAQIDLGRAAEAETALAEVLRLAPDDLHLLGEVWGVRAHAALTTADNSRALQHLTRAMQAYSRQPNEVTGSPWIGLWVLLSLVADPNLAVPPSPPDPITNRWNRGLVHFADAVALGRTGDAVAAAAAFAEADSELRMPVDVRWHRLQARRLTAAAAIADGWGDPVKWASEDLPLLEARGQDQLAAAVRGLLRRAGAVVPRRGRGDTKMPAALRALGVTSREADVLVLVREGRANREIAERLFLSPRTIEKHVERLLAKTGTTRRTELIAYAARLLDPPPAS
jgi:DNA-binding CsgD family transcriptional regulator/tetratricopeptide (TPR) repeat protein